MTPSRFKNSCELLSFFVPLGWFTAKAVGVRIREQLWIAFVLCTFGLIYSRFRHRPERGGLWIAFVLCTFGLIYSPRKGAASPPLVVNCFRSLYLWVDLQLDREWHHTGKSCELLSFFVPLGWFTAQCDCDKKLPELWIAFVLCTFGLIYSSTPLKALDTLVVNCFRSLYLWVDLQQKHLRLIYLMCCELLSFFVPLGWFTAYL